VKMFAVPEEVEQRECSKMPVVCPRLVSHLAEKIIVRKPTIHLVPVSEYQNTIENYG
jgi:hypothetical protein